MKKIHIKKVLTDYITGNRWQFALLSAILFIGMLAGAIAAASMKGETFESTQNYLGNLVSAFNLQSTDPTTVFRFALYTNLKEVLLLSICGLWVFLIPFAVLLAGIKGYKLGLAFSLCARVFGLKGVGFSIAALATQIVIFVPAFLVYGIFCVNTALFFKKVRKQKISLKRDDIYKKWILMILAVLVVAVVSAFIDAYVIPPILKPLCLFLRR